MTPGRELDAIVAEKVMGETPEDYRRRCHCGLRHSCEWCIYPRNYSTDIAAAWEVVARLSAVRESTDLGFSFHLHSWDSMPDRFVASFDHLDGCPQAEQTAAGLDGVPHAICLAALKAVGHIDK
jgi:hypothetical protein